MKELVLMVYFIVPNIAALSFIWAALKTGIDNCDISDIVPALYGLFHLGMTIYLLITVYQAHAAEAAL